MQGGASLASRLERFTTGSYSGLFNQQSNVELKNKLGLNLGFYDFEDKKLKLGLENSSFIGFPISFRFFLVAFFIFIILFNLNFFLN